MTYLLLFYGGLIVFGGILLYAINSRAGKSSKKAEQTNTLAGQETPEKAQTKESSGKSGDEKDSSEFAMTDDEYREVLRRNLKKQPETKAKKELVRDPDKYSDEQYREVLRSMHKQLHQNKESDK